MPFIQVQLSNGRIVPASGPRDAKIAIIGEAPGAYENAQLKPFVGPAGTVLEQCLHSAGLIRSECYITNVVKVQPKGNDISPYFIGTKGVFTQEGMKWVEELYEELNGVEANVLVPCGATAMAALIGLSKIQKYRGYFFESRGLREVRKVLPTIHPAAALRGQYIFRHLIASDFRKAREHSAVRELHRPQRQLVCEYGSVEEALEWLRYYETQEVVSTDIEVINFQVSCIAFSSDPHISCSIPIAGRWSELEELQIWRGVQKVLGNPNSVKVLQNAIFDVQFMLSECGVHIRGPIHDTMIAHSIMYPELLKGLGFLGSLYCGTQEYWKSLVRFDDIKDNS